MDTSNENTFFLPPKLQDMVLSLRSVSDDRLRYQQLLYLATKCAAMPNELKIPENKVPGCLSTVHVHATISPDRKVSFLGDSDAQLTKGLVAILVDGLSGSTPEEIEKVKPEFIQYAGIGTSLTPGRNNGFLNMLQLMKIKAKQLAPATNSKTNVEPLIRETGKSESQEMKSSKISMHESITTKLSMLKPAELQVEDESYKHAGHAGVSGLSSGGETHFNVRIIAACFQGLSLVQRHKMIYTLLAQEMNNGVHALSIYAKTPLEEQQK